LMTVGSAINPRTLRAAKDGGELRPVAPELDGGRGEPSGQHQANVE
jgi:hypothetical protein